MHPQYLVYEFLGTALQVYSFAYGTFVFRGLAYFIGWLISYQITGAEFNPATTIGRFIGVKSSSSWKAMALTIFI
jgi:hypothetical protein